MVSVLIHIFGPDIPRSSWSRIQNILDLATITNRQSIENLYKFSSFKSRVNSNTNKLMKNI